ncbi:MAG: undecaprenyl-diphosphate phosphatase [Puniceicoccales bacterium]|nr:undecaprenyl-diphosphate phosphatase [Puniceicoccales bacterium]
MHPAILIFAIIAFSAIPCAADTTAPLSGEQQSGKPPSAEQSQPPVRAAERLGYRAATVLGVVEGVTEYLPVSSTGHLIITNTLLHLGDDIPALDRQGRALVTKEKTPLPVRVWKTLRGETIPPAAEVPFTLKNAADAYIIVIQFGAILAVLFAYWGRVRTLLRGVFTGDAIGLRLTRNLLVAFFPAAALGFVFNSIIEQHLFGILPVVIALFLGAIVMLIVERWYRRRIAARGGDGTGYGPDLHELTVAQSLGIGVAQCAALWPGTSRSMATICGGYLAGLSPTRATEFSFLLGLVTLSAASIYKTYSTGKNMFAAFDAGPLVLGLVLATVTAFFAVKWMVSWMNRHGLALFAWYRIALAAVLLVWAYLTHSL